MNKKHGIFKKALLFIGISVFFTSAVVVDGLTKEPECSSDGDCVIAGKKGVCQNPGKESAKCVFPEDIKVPLTVIVPKSCRTCRPEFIIEHLKTVFPGLIPQTIGADTPQAKKMMQEMKIEMFPAYILSKDAEQAPAFKQFSQAAQLELTGDQYYISPSFAGMSYFANQKPEAGRLDLFVLLVDPATPHLLAVARELSKEKKDTLKFSLQFIGRKNPETGELLNPAGLREIREDKLYACVDKYYPQAAWNYLTCRTKDIDSIWWDDCLVKNAVDPAKIKQCAQTEEGAKLLEDKIRLSEKLQVTYSGLFLLDNVEIFGASLQTTTQEILNMMEGLRKVSGAGGK